MVIDTFCVTCKVLDKSRPVHCFPTSPSHSSIFSQTTRCSPLHSSRLSSTHSWHNPCACQSSSTIACNVSSGRQSPLFVSAGVMTSGIHVSAKTSVHAMWCAVATVKRIGVKCATSSLRRALHRFASFGDRLGRTGSGMSDESTCETVLSIKAASGSSCSRFECVAKL